MKFTSLEGEQLSGNKQLLEDVIERFGENERRTKADNQKTVLSKTKKKVQEMKIQEVKIWRDKKT